jgi:tripartite motif-containing protein 71
MTTAYHNVGITSQQITALMRRINALEDAIDLHFDFGFGKYAESLPGGAGEISDCKYMTISADGNRLYIVDDNANLIHRFNLGGSHVSSFGGSGTGDGEFLKPGGICNAPSAGLYVVDSQNARVQRLTSSGGYSSQFGTFGSGDGEFNFPIGIATDPDNKIYVVD